MEQHTNRYFPKYVDQVTQYNYTIFTGIKQTEHVFVAQFFLPKLSQVLTDNYVTGHTLRYISDFVEALTTISVTIYRSSTDILIK